MSYREYALIAAEAYFAAIPKQTPYYKRKSEKAMWQWLLAWARREGW